MGGIVMKVSYTFSQTTPLKFVFLEVDGLQNLIFIHRKITIKQRTSVIGILSLCWLVNNVMTNWMFFFNIIDECSWTLIVGRHWYVLFLTCLPTNIKWRLVRLVEIENQSLCNSLTASKIVTKKHKKSLIWNLWLKQWYMTF